MVRLAALVLLLIAPAFGRMRIATVNMESALITSDEGERAARDMQTRYREPKARVEAGRKEIQALKDRLANEAISNDDRTRLTGEISEKSRSVGQLNERMRQEVETERIQLLTALAKKMNAIIEAYAKKKKFGLIIDISNANSSILYVKPDADITAEVIKRYNAVHPVR